eukprot:scaffold158601_cov30-Tisochrysis_lutea.AAC.4
MIEGTAVTVRTCLSPSKGRRAATPPSIDAASETHPLWRDETPHGGGGGGVMSARGEAASRPGAKRSLSGIERGDPDTEPTASKEASCREEGGVVGVWWPFTRVGGEGASIVSSPAPEREKARNTSDTIWRRDPSPAARPTCAPDTKSVPTETALEDPAMPPPTRCDWLLPEATGRKRRGSLKRGDGPRRRVVPTSNHSVATSGIIDPARGNGTTASRRARVIANGLANCAVTITCQVARSLLGRARARAQVRCWSHGGGA